MSLWYLELRLMWTVFMVISSRIYRFTFADNLPLDNVTRITVHVQ